MAVVGQFAVLCLAHEDAPLIWADDRTEWYATEGEAVAEASRAARDNPKSRFGVVKIVALIEVSEPQRKGA